MAFLKKIIGKAIKRSAFISAVCCVAFVCVEPHLDSERTVSKSFLRAANQVCISTKNNGLHVLDYVAAFAKASSKNLKNYGSDLSHAYTDFKKDTSGVSSTYTASVVEHWDRVSVFLTSKYEEFLPKRKDKKIVLEPSPIELD